MKGKPMPMPRGMPPKKMPKGEHMMPEMHKEMEAKAKGKGGKK